MATATQDCDFSASRVGTVRSSYIAPIPLIVLATGLRLIVKLRKTNGNSFVLDDLLIVFATVGILLTHAWQPTDLYLRYALSANAQLVSCMVRKGARSYWLLSNFRNQGPPHGFGRHTCAVSLEDLKTFQIV